MLSFQGGLVLRGGRYDKMLTARMTWTWSCVSCSGRTRYCTRFVVLAVFRQSLRDVDVHFWSRVCKCAVFQGFDYAMAAPRRQLLPAVLSVSGMGPWGENSASEVRGTHTQDVKKPSRYPSGSRALQYRKGQGVVLGGCAGNERRALAGFVLNPGM